MRTATIQPTGTFDLKQSLGMLREAGWGDAHDEIDIEAGRLTRLVRIDGAPYLVTVRADDSGPELHVTVRAADGKAEPTTAEVNAAVAWVTNRFWLDADMDDVRDTLAVDEYGSSLIERFWPVRPAAYASAWEGLVVVLVNTQISRAFGRQLQTELAQRYGTAATVDGQTYHLLPTPEQLLTASVEELRDLRLSRQKATYLIEVARTVVDEPDLYDFRAMEQRSGDVVVEQLDRLYGVGPFTATTVAAFGVCHPDVLVDDQAVRASLAPHYADGEELTGVEFRDATARFAPYRTFACTYAYMDYFGDADATDEAAASEAPEVGTIPVRTE